MSAKKGQRRLGHIRKLESGRFQASFIGPDLKRYNGPVTFDSKMLAEGWLARERKLIQLAAYDGTDWISPAQRKARAAVVGQTLGDYATHWIANRNLAPRTRKLYGECASAVEQELLIKNPCAIKRAMSTNRKREPVLLSVSELARVAESIEPQRFKALVLLSAWAALRFGEVTELRRKDIGEGCEVITISRAVTHRAGCHLGSPKSGKSRTIVLPPHIRTDIKHHLDTYVPNDPEALLFPSARGACHLSQNVFREAFLSACKSVGREGVTVHALRHLGATLAARAGATVAEVQNRLGHSTVRAAMRYQHSEATRQTDIASALSKMATKPKLAVVTDEPAASA